MLIMAPKTLMCVGHNVQNNGFDARDIMFQKSVANEFRCSKTCTWIACNSPEICCAVSIEYSQIPIEAATIVMNTTEKLFAVTAELNNIAVHYQKCAQTIGATYDRIASIEVSVNAANIAHALNTANTAAEATRKSRIANSAITVASNVVIATNRVRDAATNLSTRIFNAGAHNNIEAYTIAMNVAPNAMRYNTLIPYTTTILNLALTALDKAEEATRVIATAEKLEGDKTMKIISNKSYGILRAANDTVRASAAFAIAANNRATIDTDNTLININSIERFLTKGSRTYHYICILQQHIDIMGGIDVPTSMYICDVIYNMFSGNALKNVVLVITNKDYLTKLQTTLYEEAYKNISGEDDKIPIIYSDFNAKNKRGRRAVLTHSLNKLRYSGTNKEYIPILPDMSRHGILFKMKNAVRACLTVLK